MPLKVPAFLGGNLRNLPFYLPSPRINIEFPTGRTICRECHGPFFWQWGRRDKLTGEAEKIAV
jgi:hypothetical protein